MKNILIPTDFSENATNAIDYALQLHKDQECVFYFLNTYTPAIIHRRFLAVTKPKDDLKNKMGAKSKNNLKVLLDNVRDKFKNEKHQFMAISSFSLLTEEIKDIIDERKIDLIVMGTKGASGLKEVFIGSNAVRVLKSVKECPVLVIPEYSEFNVPKEIAFVTDFNKFYAHSELEPLKKMATTFGAMVRIVHIKKIEKKPLTELQRFNLNTLLRYLKDTDHNFHTVPEVNSVSKTLEIFGKEFNTHMLAMLNYNHSFIENVMHKPIVEQTAFYTKFPLLVLPESSLKYNRKAKKNKVHFSYK